MQDKRKRHAHYTLLYTVHTIHLFIHLICHILQIFVNVCGCNWKSKKKSFISRSPFNNVEIHFCYSFTNTLQLTIYHSHSIHNQSTLLLLPLVIINANLMWKLTDCDGSFSFIIIWWLCVCSFLFPFFILFYLVHTLFSLIFVFSFSVKNTFNTIPCNFIHKHTKISFYLFNVVLLSLMSALCDCQQIK